MNVSCEQVHVKLGGREILKGISLTVPDRKVTGIIGPNGCGKSTLIKSSLGLLPLSGGRVLFDRVDAASLSPKVRASMAGYVGQENACVFDFTVSQVAAMGLYARKSGQTGVFRTGMRSSQASSQLIVEEALNELQIAHLKDRSILSLSGGERKLVFIARALVQGADTLILDEPTNHLDIRHQLFLLDYLRNCGLTVLIILHDLRLAAHYCDLVYLLSDGNLVCGGTPEEVLSEERVFQVFGIHGHAYRTEGGEKDFSLFP